MSVASDSRLLTLDSVPKLWRLARLEYDQVRQRPVRSCAMRFAK